MPRKKLTRVALALAALLFAACGGGSGTQSPAAPAVAAKVEGAVKEPDLARITLSPEAEKRLGIELAQVEHRNVSRAQVLGGEIVPVPGRTWIANAPFAGTVAAPEGGVPSVGVAIRAGQPMLRLLPLAASGGSDTRIEAEREAASADARLDAARSRLKRAEQLLADRAGSARSVEEAREQAKIAEAEANAARARLARAKLSSTDAIGGLMLNAAQDGVVQKLHVIAGQTVPAGAPLFEAAATAPLWVRVPVYAGLAGSLARGSAAQVQRLGARASAGVEARPVAAPPAGDASAATVDLYFEVANREGMFRPGERVNVAVPTSGEERSLVVPWAAVLYDIHGGAWVYESVGDHKYMRRRIDVRYVSSGIAVLARGPASGAKVVTHGAAELFGTEFSTGK